MRADGIGLGNTVFIRVPMHYAACTLYSLKKLYYFLFPKFFLFYNLYSVQYKYIHDKIIIKNGMK